MLFGLYEVRFMWILRSVNEINLYRKSEAYFDLKFIIYGIHIVFRQYGSVIKIISQLQLGGR